MDHVPVRYIVLRDRAVWEKDGVTLTGLQADALGALTLARVPGTANGRPIVRPAPYDVAPSGLGVAPNGDVYLSDTSGRAVVRVMRSCGDDERAIRRRVDTPRGIAIASGRLYVADSSRSRVLILHLLTLELLAVWEGRLDEPRSLAADADGRIYVLDRGLNLVLRFDRHGAEDAAFGDAFAAHMTGASLSGVAVGGNLTYVADDLHGVAVYGSDGQFLRALARAGGPNEPGVVVAHGERLYAADAETGAIHVHQDRQGWLGTLADYRGPVSAMACDSVGRLYLKPDDAAHYEMLEADAAYVGTGDLRAGPFDGGELSQWERVHAEVDRLANTSVALRLFTSGPSQALPSTAATAPVEADWASDGRTLAPALDTLVSRLAGSAQAPDAARYLWLRVRLTTTDAHRSPRLLHVEAATQAPSYMDHLPAVYRREDEPQQFLARWLALFRADLSDWDLSLDEMPRRINPETAPVEGLPSLAPWLAFKLPERLSADEWRTLLARVSRLYERRGTVFGLREFVDLYTGTRPDVFEAFHERHIWQLGHPASTLGFGTGLAPALPDGMIVPGFTDADPALAGLRGDYYSGINFDRLELARVDRVVNFDWGVESPAPGRLPSDHFSVRWSGQVQPRYSELYTFFVTANDGVRLRINGRLIVDDWQAQSRTERAGQSVLTAGRWYAVTLEHFDSAGPSSTSLAWSSVSQAREVVPRDRLYSIVDENARLGQGFADAVLVGQTIVGESGPSAAADFGAPLFSDKAHLFTVLVPAAKVNGPAQRTLLSKIVEDERPAHTDVHLCIVDARMRVGFQARVGIDAIVADLPDAMSLNGSRLGVESYLGDDDDSGENRVMARVGKHARVGRDSVAGDGEPR